MHTKDTDNWRSNGDDSRQTRRSSSGKPDRVRRIRMVIVCVRSGSSSGSDSNTEPDMDALWRHFERYGPIESMAVMATADANVAVADTAFAYRIVYKFASGAEILLAQPQPRAAIAIGKTVAAVDVRAAPQHQQPPPYSDQLSTLPDICLDVVLGHLGPYDLYRVGQLNERLQLEAGTVLATRDFHFDRFEWRVIRDRKMVFNERYGPRTGHIEIMKCVHGRLTTLEFDLDDAPPTNRTNADWLALMHDCARHLPSPQLQHFTLNYLSFDGVSMSPLLPLFQHLTTLTMYRVSCDEYQMQQVFDAIASTLRHLQLSHMDTISGAFLLHRPFQLRSLSLYKCPHVLAAEHQLQLVWQQRALRDLHWEQTRGIDSQHFAAMAECQRRLEALDFDTVLQRSPSAFHPDQPDLCRLLMNLPRLRCLRLRLDARFASICMALPVGALAHHNTLRRLSIHGGRLDNALLIAVGRLRHLQTLVLARMHHHCWEPYSYAYDAGHVRLLCQQPMVDVAAQLRQLQHFGVSFARPAPDYPGWLVRFVEHAGRLETLACERGGLLSLALVRDLAAVCRRRGSRGGHQRGPLHVTMLANCRADEDFLEDCRHAIAKEGAGDVIRVREQRSDDPN